MRYDQERLVGLGQRIAARREHMGIAEQTEAAARAGISAQTWRAAERGEQVRPSTWLRIDRALHWHPRSCLGYVTTGAEPVVDEPDEPADSEAVDPLLDEIMRDEDLPDDVRAELLQLRAEQIAEESQRQAAEAERQRAELTRVRRALLRRTGS